MLEGHTGEVNWIKLIPNEEEEEKFISYSRRDKTIRVWNLQTGNTIRTLIKGGKYIYFLFFFIRGAA